MKRLYLLILIAAAIPLSGFGQYSDVSDLPPLNEMGDQTFKGHKGGLYPDGSNEMPKPFFNDAVEMAKSIQPLDAEGNPSPTGKIGLIALGASTVTMFSKGLEVQLKEQMGINRELVFVDCGIGGQDLSKIMVPTANFWTVIDERLTTASITREQVQVMFFQEDNLKDRSADLDQRGEGLVEDFTYMANFVKKHYPNLKIMYITGRHTTAYMPADAQDKHREPRAYINGWACKWLIEKQINGDPKLSYKGDHPNAPLIMWGPYFWTQGTTPRKDGYYWGPDLVSHDGVHPNDAGIERVAKDLIQFWREDPVSQIWFFENPGTIANDKYMQVSINKALVDQILYSDLQDQIQIMILKDSVAVYKKDLEKAESYEISLEDEGEYKYLITDRQTKAFAGKFTIDGSGNVVVTQRTFADITSDPDGGEKILTNMESDSGPAWIVNGKDKMPKLKRLMSGNENVKAVFKSSDGKTVLEIQDIFNKHSDLNKLLERGEYTVAFYDANGKEIILPADQASNMFRIKY